MRSLAEGRKPVSGGIWACGEVSPAPEVTRSARVNTSQSRFWWPQALYVVPAASPTGWAPREASLRGGTRGADLFAPKQINSKQQS